MGSSIIGSRPNWHLVGLCDCVPRRTVGVLTLMLLLGASTVEGQDAHRAILAEKFRSEIEHISQQLPGVLGVQVIDLTSGEQFGVNEELVFPQASAIKVAVLVELYHQVDEGTLRIGDRVTIDESHLVGGSQLQYAAPLITPLSRAHTAEATLLTF